VVYGAVSIFRGWHHCNNPDEPFYICDEAFGVLPNLCMSVHTKIFANVYYDISVRGKKKFFWRSMPNKTCRADHGNLSCTFWDDFVPEQKRFNKTVNQIWECAIFSYSDHLRKRELLKNLFGVQLGSWFSSLKFKK
jgi:hypothetical protein